MAGAKAVLTSEENIFIAFEVESASPASNRLLDNLFWVKSSDSALDFKKAVSQSHPDSVVPRRPTRYLEVSLSTLIILGPISGLQLSILIFLFALLLSAFIPSKSV